MALDLIKEYLVGIGFKVDDNSFKNAQSSMDQTGDKIKKFNKDNNKGFSESGDSLKDLFSLFKTSSATLGQLFPEARGPFKSMIRDVTLLKKLYGDFAGMKKESADSSKTTSKSHPNSNSNTKSTALTLIPDNKAISETKNLVDVVLNAKDATKSLAVEGGNAFKLFSAGALGPIAAVAIGVISLTLATKKLVDGITELAQQDVQYEKLSRQLWTTKENAKEIDSALKTMGVSMQDLWLSPTLLKQFNELRRDSASLKLPKEYTDNLKVVQGIGQELNRLKQLGSLAFQWIGNYILKYASGPLKEIKQDFKGFNDWLVKNIPNIGKAIGSTIGILIKIISVILKIGGALLKLFSPIITLIKFITSLGDEFSKLPEPVQKAFKTITTIILALASPIIAIILLIDDLLSYFKGGKSVTGSFIEKISKEFESLGKNINSVISFFKNLKKEILDNGIVKSISQIGTSFKKGIDDIGKGDFKGLIADIGLKVKDFSSANVDKAAASYVTSNTSTSNSTNTSNSNNKVTNQNTFNVYGNDSKSTANTISNKVNGLNTRNLQGVIV